MEGHSAIKTCTKCVYVDATWCGQRVPKESPTFEVKEDMEEDRIRPQRNKHKGKKKKNGNDVG